MSQKIYGLQVLRFAAASGVVIDHAILQVAGQRAADDPLLRVSWFIGDCGVILFFAISGFIMMVTNRDKFGSSSSAIAFLTSRLLRIFPLYFLVTTAQFINKFYSTPLYTFENYGKSLLFIPYIGDDGHMRPILGQGWTLNYEMFFYLIFALSLTLPKRLGLSICIVLLAILGFGSGGPDAPSVAMFYTTPLLFYFVFGIGCALAIEQTKVSIPASPQIFAGLALPIAATVAIGFLYGDAPFATAARIALVSGCVFICANMRQSNGTLVERIAEYLGDASYSTYLCHGFVLGAAKVLSSRIVGGNLVMMIGFILLMIVVANVGGALVFTFIERPIARLLRVLPVRRAAIRAA